MHGTLIAATATVLPPHESKKKFWVVMLLCIISSCIPDTDVVAFRFGIPYGHMFGHRGFSHSIAFGFIWGGLMTVVFRRIIGKGNSVWMFILFSLVTISHGVLDAMTTGGKGIGFFIPFINERYFLPWRFIAVSPLSVSSFFSEWGLKVLGSELLYIGVPCLVIFFAKTIFRKTLPNSNP